MQVIEYKSMPSFELSDMDKEHRTAIIAHANYGNIDRLGDICHKGMFNKSWTETKAGDIRFDIDHDKKLQPGRVLATTENEKKAFTKVSFGNHTLGNDTMIMMDEGIIRGASFEFVSVADKNPVEMKGGRKIRDLKEVKHRATTVTLSLPPINPEAGVISVTKAQDLDSLLAEFKSYVIKMKSFCHNTTASDDCIIKMQNEIKAAEQFLSSFDTAFTQVATEPDASRDDNDRDAYLKQLTLLNLQLSA